MAQGMWMTEAMRRLWTSLRKAGHRAGAGWPPLLQKNLKMQEEDNVIILKVTGLDEIRLKW